MQSDEFNSTLASVTLKWSPVQLMLTAKAPILACIEVELIYPLWLHE